ncbi:MAG: SRPBCC domain-containing protein [Bradymonadales bacterium]|nr:SRPBCC domain-containing protein [Bradymonadales bacterium]
MDPLHYTVDIPATRDELWEAWTTPEGLTRWLCHRATVEPRVGGAYEIYFNPDESRPGSNSTIGCKVLSVDRPRLLRVTWRGSDDLAEIMNNPEAPTTELEVRLRPAPFGTRLEVIHSGWGEGASWTRAREWFDKAWSKALEKILSVYANRTP